MNEHTKTGAGPPRSHPPLAPGLIGRFFHLAAVAGLGLFGLYIVLRAAGATPKNFEQWQALVAGQLVCEAPDGSLRLTRRGRLLSDGVFEVFV